MALIENLQTFFKSWKYLGRVKSLRSEYCVFELDEYYAVIRPDNRFKNSYNVTFFEQQTLSKILELIQEKRNLTTAKIVNLNEVKIIFPDQDNKTRQLLLLQALFVLVCKGLAKMRKKGREISFSFEKT